MFTGIYNHLEKFSLTFCRQFGFRSKHSTIDAFIDFTEKCGQVASKTQLIDLKKQLIQKNIPFYNRICNHAALEEKPIGLVRT